MLNERRRKRSSYTTLSLHYWLCEVARRHDLLALVVADAGGHLIGASMRGPEAEELAAMAPLLARTRQEPMSVPVQATSPAPVTIEQIAVEGSSLYVCAVGESRRSQSGLRQAASGLERILRPVN